MPAILLQIKKISASPMALPVFSCIIHHQIPPHFAYHTTKWNNIPKLQQYIKAQFVLRTMASQPGCIHFKPDTVQHTYQSPIPVPQHYKTAIKNNLHVEALDQKDPKKNVKQVPLTTGTFQTIVEILDLSSTRTSFSFAKKIFFSIKIVYTWLLPNICNSWIKTKRKIYRQNLTNTKTSP